MTDVASLRLLLDAGQRRAGSHDGACHFPRRYSLQAAGAMAMCHILFPMLALLTNAWHTSVGCEQVARMRRGSDDFELDFERSFLRGIISSCSAGHAWQKSDSRFNAHSES